MHSKMPGPSREGISHRTGLWVRQRPSGELDTRRAFLDRLAGAYQRTPATTRRYSSSYPDWASQKQKAVVPLEEHGPSLFT